MEFTGDRGGSRSIRSPFYLTRREEEEEEEHLRLDVTCKRPPFPAPSSSSSSAYRWREDVAVSSVIDRGGGDQKGPEREHMFDKVVTPSDVGKLNRLVIPKQHAEKHFPLDTASAAERKGLLLCFEDRVTGKPWRFRYSYWHSSQSYVVTKGWSRFVKEKGLRAGDTVSFSRGVGEAARHRFFIDCRRLPEKCFPSAAAVAARIPLPGGFSSFAPPWIGAGRAFFPSAVGHRLLHFKTPAPQPPQVEVQQEGGAHRCFASEMDAAPGVKRVRLFGVNLDCSGSGDGADNYSQLLQPPITSPPPLQPPQRIKEQRSSMDLYL